MEQKIKVLDNEIRDLYAKAKSSRGSQQKFVKQKLLNLLKKKKMYEQQMNQYYGNQMALENIKFTNENIQQNQEMFAMIKESNDVQKKNMQKMDMDEMSDIMMDQKEMQMEMNLMNEEMNAHMDNDYDEDDLDEELAQMENDGELLAALGQNPHQQQANQNQATNDPFL